ncbi:hypothetical protein [Pseudobacteriovorax antillogorgiicola]|uniref:Lipoprotein n=1 Tax=Pseudobacteriovorax antillogorgiicola TaxID=1513793 RepID=A0A1Y6BYK6_9BACT|nr:hypothetical protein [Pseudobacteriovorax antillogorgiicola]TCS53175.1 hypothetical protein EDD56_108226 [Pseudobacteriovorax antillogorgiicola]SMF24599.1 hypothetical protein SAMN06296036_10820 [Pseudobacteriovorax antillogorgiicola]
MLRQISLLFLLLITSCDNGSGSLQGDGDRNQAINATAATSNKADRPSEQGAGLPGYSIFCSINDMRDTEVDVGCHLTDGADKRAATPENAWAFYEVQVAPEFSTVSVSKKLPENRRYWDILFTYSGAEDANTIRQAINNSTFVYEYVNEVSELDALVTTAFVEEIPLPTQDCSTGETLDGICYFKTSTSCAYTCGQVNSTPHINTLNVIGSMQPSNINTCGMLYRKINGDNTLQVETVDTGFGLGCYKWGSKIYWDQTPTNTTWFPPLGGDLLCACDTQTL